MPKLTKMVNGRRMEMSDQETTDFLADQAAFRQDVERRHKEREDAVKAKEKKNPPIKNKFNALVEAIANSTSFEELKNSNIIKGDK